MEIINQTNRTLLLDVINPDKMDLLTLVGDVKGQDSLSHDRCGRLTSIWNVIVTKKWSESLSRLSGLSMTPIHSLSSIHWSGRRIFRNLC